MLLIIIFAEEHYQDQKLNKYIEEKIVIKIARTTPIKYFQSTIPSLDPQLTPTLSRTHQP